MAHSANEPRRCAIETEREEKELPLVFRLDWQIPVDFTEFEVRYEYYPIESFVDRRVAEPAS